MAELGLVGGAFLGAVVNQLLDELVTSLRCWKSRNANLRHLDKLLQRLQPFVRELDSSFTSCSEAGPAHVWLNSLEQELRAASELLDTTRITSNGILSQIFRSKKLVQLNESISSLVLEAALAQWASGLSTTVKIKDDLAHVATDVAGLRATGERQERLLVEIGQTVTSQSSNSSKRDTMCTLNQLRTDFCSFGILNDGSSSSRSSREQSFRTRTHASSEPQIYIQNYVADRVISLLMDGGKKWVGLWAMGGAGKTFAAKRVLDDPRIEELFTGGRYWLTVSKDKPPKELLLKNLYEDLFLDQFPHDPEEARCKVKSLLSSRGKALLVLDDVWDRDILNYLDVVSEGNILVTTRDEENLRGVAKFAEIVEIPPLSEECSWQLFSWHAFGAQEEDVPPEIEAVARDVAKECKGLPLALEVIGAAMAGKLLFDWEETHLGKSMRQEWQTVLEQLQSGNVHGDEYNELYHKLQLSVDNLHDVDPRLPDCFFYFAAFPEDYDVEIEGLVNMWIAEGLVKQNSGSPISCESEAKFLLGLLIARSMIQLSEQGHQGQPRCKIHDVMRDVARVNLKNNFGKNPKWWKVEASLKRSRKIEASELHCLYEPGLDLVDFPGEWKVRTRNIKFCAERLSLRHNSLRHLPNAFKAPGLRVLMLAHNSNLQTLPPKFFRSFSHLRVLDLSFTGIVRVDGRVLQPLKSLVLLDLRGCFYLEEVSDKIDSLPNLETILLCYCANLKTLPLVKNLTKLETFSMDIPCLIQPAQWRERMPMFQMRHLKRLYIGSRDVGLFGIGEPMDLRNIPFLVGSQALEELWLRRMTAIPSGMTQFSHLKILALSAFPKVYTLPAFDKLRALERLVICDFPDLRILPASFGHSGAFPSLRAVHLYALPKVDKLFTFHPGAMRMLERLEIEHLPLKELPTFLTVFGSVKRLSIRRSVNGTDAGSIRRENLESVFSERNCFPNLESLEIECIGSLPTATSFSKLGSLVCDIPRDRCPPSILQREREGKLKIVEKNVNYRSTRPEDGQR